MRLDQAPSTGPKPSLITSPGETPPDDKAAIKLARETVARPDAYAYNIRRTRSGLMLSVIVDIQRTEWELYHAEIKKKGKGFNPSPESSESKTWFGDTDN